MRCIAILTLIAMFQLQFAVDIGPNTYTDLFASGITVTLPNPASEVDTAANKWEAKVGETVVEDWAIAVTFHAAIYGFHPTEESSIAITVYLECTGDCDEFYAFGFGDDRFITFAHDADGYVALAAGDGGLFIYPADGSSSLGIGDPSGFVRDRTDQMREATSLTNGNGPITLWSSTRVGRNSPVIFTFTNDPPNNQFRVTFTQSVTYPDPGKTAIFNTVAPFLSDFKLFESPDSADSGSSHKVSYSVTSINTGFVDIRPSTDLSGLGVTVTLPNPVSEVDSVANKWVQKVGETVVEDWGIAVTFDAAIYGFHPTEESSIAIAVYLECTGECDEFYAFGFGDDRFITFAHDADGGIALTAGTGGLFIYPADGSSSLGIGDPSDFIRDRTTQMRFATSLTGDNGDMTLWSTTPNGDNFPVIFTFTNDPPNNQLKVTFTQSVSFPSPGKTAIFNTAAPECSDFKLFESPDDIDTGSSHKVSYRVTTTNTGLQTCSPTKNPTKSPTKRPSQNPSVSPTKRPTESPSQNPSVSPTKRPTERPSVSPTSRSYQSSGDGLEDEDNEDSGLLFTIVALFISLVAASIIIYCLYKIYTNYRKNGKQPNQGHQVVPNQTPVASTTTTAPVYPDTQADPEYQTVLPTAPPLTEQPATMPYQTTSPNVVVIPSNANTVPLV